MTHTDMLVFSALSSRASVIMVVEDDDMVRLMTVDFLESCGYVVLQAESAEKAIANFDGTVIDLVFTDVQMAGPMDGIALAEWVQDNHPAVPVIVTSGVAAELERYGFGPMIAKPYDLDVVHDRIQSVLGKPN